LKQCKFTICLPVFKERAAAYMAVEALEIKEVRTGEKAQKLTVYKQ
jgi:hypothetical protein